MRFFLLLAVMLLGGCAAERTEFHELGRLQGRHEVVWIRSGPRGVVYSVTGADGRVVADNLTRAELQERLPDVAGRLDTGIAWAGINEVPEAAQPLGTGAVGLEHVGITQQEQAGK